MNTDDALRSLLALALDSDEPLQPTITVGAVLGSLDVHEATRFASLVDVYLAGGLVVTVDDDGVLRLAAA